MKKQLILEEDSRKNIRNWTCPRFAKTRYKTIDSYLMHDDSTKFDRLIVDEAFTVHFGSIVFSLLKSSVREVDSVR